MGLKVPVCLGCGDDLPLRRHYQGQLLKCRCTNPHELEFFPAAIRMAETAKAAAITSEDDASCFQHPEAAAEAVCNACGSYMCGVCATVSPDGDPVCLPCLKELSDNEEKGRWRREWTNWDTIALHLSLMPILVPIFYYAFVVTAPAAAAISIWKWNSPKKRPLPRTRARIYAALGFSLLQVGIIVAFVLILIFAGPFEDV